MALFESHWPSGGGRITHMKKAGQDKPASGRKFHTEQGFSAIKDGIKENADREIPSQRKPPWLRLRLERSEKFLAVKKTVDEHRLATVCEEGHCPNMGECWSNGTATIMLMGAVCTRACRFCAVDTGNPGGWLDAEEPANAARSVRLMNLRYVVLTSVDRDDLSDGGAAHYAACVRAIRQLNPSTAVEALTPDFCGVESDVATVVDSGLQVFAQNLETVERLTNTVRDPRAGYTQTLSVLGYAKRHRSEVLTKSSIMLGLGEQPEEIRRAMGDLRDQGVDILTLGQYLRPTKNHLPVAAWVHPSEFASWREEGLAMGFIEVASGPLVRSSYRADRILEQNNLGLPAADTLDDNLIPLSAL
jgi:lipoic acid synthetase